MDIKKCNECMFFPKKRNKRKVNGGYCYYPNILKEELKKDSCDYFLPN